MNSSPLARFALVSTVCLALGCSDGGAEQSTTDAGTSTDGPDSTDGREAESTTDATGDGDGDSTCPDEGADLNLGDCPAQGETCMHLEGVAVECP